MVNKMAPARVHESPQQSQLLPVAASVPSFSPHTPPDLLETLFIFVPWEML